MNNRSINITLLAWLVLFLPLAGHAQLSGHNTRGDFGLQSGTQAPPGFYVVPILYDFGADTLRDRNGDSFEPLGGGGSVDARAMIVGGLWVTDKKLLGGNYGFAVFPGVTNNALELPAFQMNSKTRMGSFTVIEVSVSLVGVPLLCLGGWHFAAFARSMLPY